MSLILDALRRAENARERDLRRRLGQALPPRASTRSRWILWVILVAAVVAVLMTFYISLWNGSLRDHPAVTTTVPVTQNTPPQAGASSLSEIAVPAVVVPAVTAVPAPAPTSTAPLLHELPDSVRHTVPALSLDAHVWFDDASRRFVLINMRRLREGDNERPGLRVVRITPEGVELDWHGDRFRLLAQ